MHVHYDFHTDYNSLESKQRKTNMKMRFKHGKPEPWEKRADPDVWGAYSAQLSVKIGPLGGYQSQRVAARWTRVTHLKKLGSA